MQILKDNSTFKIVWDLFLLLLILVSCILIPYQVAFQHQVFWVSSLVIYAIDAVFLLNIYFNTHTSYRSRGVEVTDKREIFRHYSRKRLPIDLLANVPFDAILLLLVPGLSLHHVSLILVLRLLRIFRVVHLFDILKSWEAHSWTHTGYLRITRFMVLIGLLNHWIACTWFMIAFIADFPEDSWVVSAGIGGAESTLQYIRSLYWTITTMTTVGYGDITPQRPEEYLVAIVVMLLGASLYAFIIGHVASLFSNLDAAKVHYWKRTEAVLQYLRYRRIPDDLNQKVRSYYEYMWARHRSLQEEQMFSDLPGALRLEVLTQLTRDLQENAPLFKSCSAPLRNVLLQALVLQTYPPDVVIAQEGELGNEIFFVSSGKLEVFSCTQEMPRIVFEEGDYFGDLSLLMHECRTASVKTLTYCEVFVLRAADFNRIKNDYPEFKEVIKKISAEKTEKTMELVLEGVVL